MNKEYPSSFHTSIYSSWTQILYAFHNTVCWLHGHKTSQLLIYFSIPFFTSRFPWKKLHSIKQKCFIHTPVALHFINLLVCRTKLHTSPLRFSAVIVIIVISFFVLSLTLFHTHLFCIKTLIIFLTFNMLSWESCMEIHIYAFVIRTYT